jgi:hypothetical protein
MHSLPLLSAFPSEIRWLDSLVVHLNLHTARAISQRMKRHRQRGAVRVNG